MPGGKDQEKTEPATPKRLEDARKKGQVAQSREIPSTVVLLSALGVLFFSGSWIFWNMSDFMSGFLQDIGRPPLSGDSIHGIMVYVSKQVLTILAPLMLFVVIAGLLSNLLQVGFLFTGQVFIPKLSKLNPVSGMKRLFSLKAFVELSKSFFKILLIGSIAYVMVMGELEAIPSLTEMGVADILSFIGRTSFRIWLFSCLALICLAALDYFFQRWQYEKDMKMTKQEVKDESKQREGDPAVRARIRNIQREISGRRMMEAVPEADVVITNPTRLAIALRYDADVMMAPKIVAKAANHVAERIKEIAQNEGIPIVENRILAQTLFKAVEIGESIPSSLYRAVAEVLAYVYRLRGMKERA